MPYVCPQCQKTKKLPDYCCGKSMIASGSYYCPTCGNASSTISSCCGEEMQRV
ncbi:MAG: hypothetical protein ACOYI2_00295 [Bacillota bacterium]|nr:hypothetical protein [Clostridia bacterium]